MALLCPQAWSGFRLQLSPSEVQQVMAKLPLHAPDLHGMTHCTARDDSTPKANPRSSTPHLAASPTCVELLEAPGAVEDVVGHDEDEVGRVGHDLAQVRQLLPVGPVHA